MQQRISKNAQTLENELQWLSKVIDTRFKLYFNLDTKYKNIFALEAPDLNEDNSV